MPTAAIFADTQDEPEEVYHWLAWLETQLPFPVHRVTAGSLSKEALKPRVTKDGRRYTRQLVPYFTKSPDGSLGKIRMRTCTVDFKLRPLLKAQRKLAGIKRGQKTVGVVSWIGISTDEAMRMKDSREPWATNRYPLIELNWSRKQCLDWWAEEKLPAPPRSACVFCPFHSDEEWKRLKYHNHAAFNAAVRFEQDIQAAKTETDNFLSTPFLHRSCKPLGEVNFMSEAKTNPQLDMFNNDCLGMCGV